MPKKDTNIKKRLRESIDDGKAIIGTKRTLTKLETGDLEVVVLSSSVPEDMEEKVMHLAALTSTEIEKIDATNEELGIIGKKPFSISMMGILKS